MKKGLHEIALGTAVLAAALGVLRVAALRAEPAPSRAAPAEHTGPRERAEAIASYTLGVRLDDVAQRLSARGTISWKNASRAPATELFLHLYMNAFKNDRTLFLRSPFGAGRSGDRATEWGYVDVKKLSARELGGVDLWPNAARTSPGDPEDQTDIEVPLPQPIAPGETLTLDVEFEVELPEIVERTGYKNDFYFVAQWFPKLARRLPDGGWAHFAFHPQSEFSADFGDYDVTIDVPASMIVGATGARAEERHEGGRKIVRYRAESVHDFAWTAWSRFRERSERIGAVDVRVLFPPGHDANAELQLDVLRFALPHFERRYGRYPYPTLTVVHPPKFAANAGGMEYPTLITTGGPWFLPYTGIRGIEAVTIHELGHQWFYGLVASNEHDHPFLDEGLNSFAEHQALRARYGSGSLVSWLGLEIAAESASRTVAAARAQDEVVAAPAPAFASFRDLGALVYSRTATIMTTFARVYGEARMQDALADYTRRYRFAHPGPAEFLAVMREHLGSEAARELESALFERGTIDYLVRDLQNAPADPPSGVFDLASGRETKARDPARPPPSWLGRVVVYRRGTLKLPVEVELIDEHGGRQRRRWDGREASRVFDYRGHARLVSAVVDPDRRILLDTDLTNNAVSREPSSAIRSLERAAYARGLVMHLVRP